MMIGILDTIFFVVVLIFAVSAAVHGFIKEILGKVAWVLAVFFSIFFYKKMGEVLIDVIGSEILRNIAGFVIVFLGVFIVVKIIEIILSKIFSGELVGGLNRALGFLFGVAEGFTLVFAVLFLLHAQPWINISSITQDSKINSFYEINVLPKVQAELEKADKMEKSESSEISFQTTGEGV